MGANLWWTADGWIKSEPRIDLPVRVLCAESFLVADHNVVGLAKHARRFANSLATYGVSIPGFSPGGGPPWRQLGSFMPEQGRLFPKIQAQQFADGEVFVEALIRNSRAPLTRAALITSTEQFEIRTPTIKGPDIDIGLELRSRAEVRGFGEWVRLTPDGHLWEGALTGLLWWEGDTLHVPPDDLERVDSITVQIVLDIARERGVEVVRKLRKPEELSGAEVWIASAMNGIRLVDRLETQDGAEVPVITDPQRWESWQADWKSRAERLTIQ